jgi:hypothetical protein
MPLFPAGLGEIHVHSVLGSCLVIRWLEGDGLGPYRGGNGVQARGGGAG